MATLQFGDASADMRLVYGDYGIAALEQFDAFLLGFVAVREEVLVDTPTQYVERLYDANNQSVTLSATGDRAAGVVTFVSIEAADVRQSIVGNFTADPFGNVYGTATTVRAELMGSNAVIVEFSGLSVQLPLGGTAPPDLPTDDVLLAGPDTISAGSGNDYLLGYAGSDVIAGGAGNDTLDGGEGADSLDGGIGNDVLIGESPPWTVQRISTSSSGVEATNGVEHTGEFAYSANGRYVAFWSTSTNFASGDTNGWADVFVKDLASGAVTRVSVGADGTQSGAFSHFPGVSDDGQWAVFGTGAFNLLPGANGNEQLYLKNLQSGALTRLTESGGQAANGHSEFPVISGNASTVVFRSQASNLVAGDTNETWDVFAGSVATGAITRVSAAADGTQANGYSRYAAVSADGQRVAFASVATNLAPGTANGWQDVFVKDLGSGAIVRVATMGDPVQLSFPFSYASPVAISADGRHVAFVSAATDLVAGDTNGKEDIFVADLTTGAMVLASTAADGTLANQSSFSPSLSTDGRFVAFVSVASNLVPGDTNNVRDVYLKDLQTGEVSRLSVTNAGTQVNGDITGVKLQADGRAVVFGSDAANLVPGDTNGWTDLFLSTPATAGSDTLVGGAGDEVYVLQALDSVVESASGGFDSILTIVPVYALPANVESLQYTGTLGFRGTGNGLDNRVIGGTGPDTLDGGAGGDWLYGGNGDDTYYVDGQGDLVFEFAGEGTDAVISTASFYLYGGIEKLVLAAGAGDLFGSANELDNTVTGNEGVNLLLGWGGLDTIYGGQGNDILYGVNDADVLYGESGIDVLVGGSGNDTLDGGTEADLLAGEDGDDLLTGGTDFSTDILIGGPGNDTLEGASGKGDYDLMDGSGGDDTYRVDTPDDLTFEASDGGTDTVIADISGAGYYLYANVENVELKGSTPYAVGNELNNVLSGSDQANWLLAGAGNDTINGKAGWDVLFGETGSDTFVFERGTEGDVIGDFLPGTDKIQLVGIGYKSIDEVKQHMVEHGNVSAIDLGAGDFVVLHNVTIASLSAGDFVFG